VLIITHEPLRQNLSGPGIRALEMGRTLSERHAVTVATPFPPEVSDDRCTFARYSFDRPESLSKLAEHASVLIVQGFTLARFPVLASLRIPIVVDLYCPFTLEHLEMLASRPDVVDALWTGTDADDDRVTPDVRANEADVAGVLGVQNMQLSVGDFFICASERQRDFWIGALHTAGRINLRTYAADSTLRSLIDVVPFGLAERPPTESAADGRVGMNESQPGNVLKGVRPGFHADDHVLLWGGSILDWQDPQTLVRAVASIASRRKDIKLFFMGTRHPNPQVPPMRAVSESIALARDLNVLDTQVFFNDWVPYADRWRYLMEADLGCSTHRDHLETRLSFRTRMLDYLWAGVPIVCTEGDVFASLVADRGLGLVVAPGDVNALAFAIERLIDDQDERMRCRRRLLETAEEFRWHRVVRPLARFCATPRLAADRQAASTAVHPWTQPGYRMTNWVKRTILATGISRKRIEQIKRLPPVRRAMSWHSRALFSQSTQTFRPADSDGSAKSRSS
jgi:glycosyltransferase involved in cell wall biosynthesis